jgi:enoyl-CoA hydratase
LKAIAAGAPNPRGTSRAAAEELARELSALPQICLRGDRASTHESVDLDLSEAILNELKQGVRSLAAGESEAGALRFSGGKGRHGSSGSD